MRPSIRVRLAAWYIGLTALSGLVLLGITFLLVVPALPTLMVHVQSVPMDTDRISPANTQAIAAEAVNIRAQVGSSLVTWGSVTLLALAVLSACVGWLLSGRMLRPVRAVTSTARRVAERNLHERIALTGPPDELKELADTFDAMVARLERSFDGQRRFIANASHELRTPLTTARAVAEVAATAPNASPDARRLGAKLLTITTAQERLLDSLLALAHDETTIDRGTEVDLAELAADAADIHAEAARDAGIELRTELTPAPLLGDSALLARMVHNLVDNAIRYNVTEQGFVTVHSRLNAGAAQLAVVNSGPAIDPADATTLFEPFRRLRYDRTQHPRGSGLGLSVVRAVVRAHQGSVSAQPRTEGGLAMRVSIPVR